MKRILCWTGLAATLALGLTPAAAVAENYHYHFRGSSAYASFSSTDSTGCIWTDISVSLYENRFQQPPGPPDEGAALDAYFYQYDSCQGIYLSYGGGWGSLPAGAFDISPSLHSASVTATIEAYDWLSGNPITVSVDLDWTGVGDTFRGNSRYQTNTPQYRYMSRSVGSSREAQAAGTILLGTTNLATGSSWASLHSNQSGFLSVSR